MERTGPVKGAAFSYSAKVTPLTYSCSVMVEDAEPETAASDFTGPAFGRPAS